MADNKDLVRRVGGYTGDEHGSYVVYDSRNPSIGKKQDLGSSAKADKVAGVLNQLQKDADVVRKEMDIWRGVTPGYGSNIHGQQSINGLMDLKTMREGADVIVYDTETLGTTPFQRKNASNLDFYTPTEIGFKHAKLVNGQLSKDGKSLSMLMRPDEEVYKRLNGLINGISNGNWAGMTDDVRRTLSDLTLYAGNKNELFTEEIRDDGRRIVSVNKQARQLHPLKGSVLSSSDNIAAMRQGLENLMKMGTTPEHAIVEMNHFMRGMQDTKFAGYNVYNFDQPMMMDWLNNQIGKHAQDSQVNKTLDKLKHSMALGQIDGLHAVRTLYRDTYSRYGDNVTLETMKKVFKMDGEGQSHHALSDVNVTIEQLNRLMQDPALEKVLNTGGKKGGVTGYYDDTPLKVGDRLFGVKGLTSTNAGEYDGVYRRKDGKLQSAYDMKPNPIYRNATYEVQRMFENLDVDGKKMFGIELYNETDDLVHTIFRDTMGDLQNAVHGHLEHIEKVTATHKQAGRIQNQDRGLRRWNKMFSTESGGGVQLATRMYDTLDIQRRFEATGKLDVNAYMSKGMTRKQAQERVARNQARVNKTILGRSQYNTDEFVRDFQTIRGRLEGEEDWVRGFLKKIKADGPNQKSGDVDWRAQNMAFTEFGRLMDENLGRNMKERDLPNNGRALQLTRGDQSNYIQLGSADAIRGSLYGHLYDPAGRPNKGELKKRYRDMLGQLKAQDALSAKKFEQFYKEMDGTRRADSFDNLMAELANELAAARERNAEIGIKGISVEDPTRVRGVERGTRGHGIRYLHGKLFDPLANQALRETQPYRSRGGSGKLQIHGEANDVIMEHDKAMKALIERNGVKNPNMKSATTSIQQMVEAYEKDFRVQIRYNGKTKGLQMVLADKEVAESVLNGDIKDVLASKQTAVINLANMNKDGTITRGAQNRVARLEAKRRNGGYEYVTAFDDIISAITGNAPAVKRMMEEGKADGRQNTMFNINGHLERTANKAMQNLSMNNRYTDKKESKEAFHVTSAAANWVRGGVIDISNLAEEWYEGWHMNLSQERKDLWRVKTPDQIRELAKENKNKFVENMGMIPQRIYQREADDFANQRLGTTLGMHSLKDTHVGNYLRANSDIRELHAFGFFNPMARENISKTVNYLALEKEQVRKKLKKEGFSDSEIERMLNRGVATDQALDVMEDYMEKGTKTSYLNMRAAYMNNGQLNERATELVETYTNKALELAESAAKEGITADEREKFLKDQQKFESYAERLKNAQSVSTFDGMMIMSEEAGRAFDTTREKKIKLSPGAQLTAEMQQLLESSASRNDMPFDLNKDMVFDKNMAQLDRIHQYEEFNKNPNGQTKLDYLDRMDAKNKHKKSITISEITKEDLIFSEDGVTKSIDKSVDQKLEKWNNHQYYVKGWNAEEQTLILEERVRNMSGTKYITDAGDRVTATLLPHEIVADLAGVRKELADFDKSPEQRINAIMPSFEVKKGMHGGELKKIVELAVDEARAQISGDHQGRLTTAGDVAKNDALADINRLFIKSFGIKDESLSEVKDGRIVVDKFIGTEGKEIDYSMKSMHTFLSGVDNMLGTQFADGKTVMGNVGIGKQNIYDWENSIGLTDGSREGLVKYGRKEVDMIATRANQILGKGSAVVGWLEEHMTVAAKAQHADINRIAGGLIRTAVEAHDITPDKGDVVIRTTGTAFSAEDPTGRRTGRTTAEGVREVSMHALDDLPEITARDTLFVAEDYSKTVVDFGRADGMFEDGTSFQKAIKDNGGTALLEMPDESFAKKHIRLVDFGDVAKGGTAGTPILQEIQDIQKRIWSGIKEYQHVDGQRGQKDEERLARIRGRVDDLTLEYEDKAAHMVSSARDSSIMKTLGSAKMDMAGRFRIQGVNPMAEGKVYQEGAAYVSKERFVEMIKGGGEKAMADHFDIKSLEVEGKKLTVAQLMKSDLGKTALHDEIVKKMLDPENTKGLYGFVNRYPTIKQSTIQALEIKIDETMASDDRTARMAAGTANLMKADNDGDFMSAVLGHYKAKEAGAIHDELKRLQSVEAEAGRKMGEQVRLDVEGDMNKFAKEWNMTVGDFAMQAGEARELAEEHRTDRQRKILEHYDAAYTRNISHARTAKDALETREARLGKAFVGIIDNTRDKVLNLATATMETLEAAGRVSSIRTNTYRNVIEEGLAHFSQELISSKKFSVDTEIKRLTDAGMDAKKAEVQATKTINERHFKVADMSEYLMNLTNENRESFVSHNNEINLFDVNNVDESIAKAERVRMDTMLDMIQDVQRWTASAGGARNASLGIGVSEGAKAHAARNLLGGGGDMTVPTAANKTIAGAATGAVDEATQMIGQQMERSMGNFRNTVVQQFDNSSGAADSLIQSLPRGVDLGEHSLSGATVAEETGQRFKETLSKFTPKAFGNGGGFAGGAIAFGAIWAASAMARSGPTPEGLQEQTQQPAPVPKQAMQTPTARITQNNGEFVNIRVSAKNAQNMSEQEVAALVHQEIGAMTSMKMDTTLNVNDNTQNINQEWLQGVLANAIEKGFGF